MNLLSIYTSVIYDLWGLLAFVWLIFTFINKRTVRREGIFGQFLVLILLFIGFAFIFNPYLSFIIIRYRFYIPSSVGWFGVFLTACGVVLAVWARFVIGRNWSGAAITLKENHKLVQTGAYSIMRHPIYAGLLLAAVGMMITKGTIGDLIGIAFLLAAFLIRIPKEEKLMSEQFPEEYPEYMKRVKALIPFLF